MSGKAKTMPVERFQYEQEVELLARALRARYQGTSRKAIAESFGRVFAIHCLHEYGCQNGREAIAYLQSQPVDLLFLDVQMPKIDGFAVVEQVGLQHLPLTVFVTAYHEHAVRAFDIHAVDYLTKPVDAERLARALGRVREKNAAKAALLTQEQLAAVLNGLRNSTEQPTPYLSLGSW